MADKVYKVGNGGTQEVGGKYVSRPEPDVKVKTGTDLRAGKGK